MGWKYKSAMYVEVTTALEPAAVGKKVKKLWHTNLILGWMYND